MANKRRRRSGHKPRGVDPDAYSLDLRMRSTVRRWMRHFEPDTPMPSGNEWLVTTVEATCQGCGCDHATLIKLRPAPFILGWCPHCDQIGIVKFEAA